MDQKNVALVTGGSAGLGEEIALDLQRDGFDVIVCGRRQDKLDAMEVTCFEFSDPPIPIRRPVGLEWMGAGV